MSEILHHHEIQYALKNSADEEKLFDEEGAGGYGHFIRRDGSEVGLVQSIDSIENMPPLFEPSRGPVCEDPNCPCDKTLTYKLRT